MHPIAETISADQMTQGHERMPQKRVPEVRDDHAPPPFLSFKPIPISLLENAFDIFATVQQFPLINNVVYP